MSTKKSGSAPTTERSPVAETYNPTFAEPRDIARDVSESRSMSPWTCSRCQRSAFIRDAAGLSRCMNCAMPQRYAVCSDCGNGAMAHGIHGCEGVADDGNPCECQRHAPTGMAAR